MGPDIVPGLVGPSALAVIAKRSLFIQAGPPSMLTKPTAGASLLFPQMPYAS